MLTQLTCYVNIMHMEQIEHKKKGGSQIMSNVLDSVQLDIPSIIDDLQYEWLSNPDSKFNTSALTKQKPGDGNVQCNCPYHTERNPSFGIQTEPPYRIHCFGCEAGGTIIDLIQHVMKLPTPAHAEHYLLKTYVKYGVDEREPIDLDCIFGKNEAMLSKHDSVLDSFKGVRHNYMYSRGFSDRALDTYEIGYDKDTDTMVIPIRHLSGELRFLKRRGVKSKTFLNEKGIYKKDIIFGLHNIVKSLGKVDTLYLTESETDVVACFMGGLLAGSIMGRILFKEQVVALLKAGVKHVILFYDNDEKGIECMHKSYEMLCKTPIKVSVVRYPHMLGLDTLDPDEIVHKDANDLLKAGLLKNLKTLPYESLLF